MPASLDEAEAGPGFPIEVFNVLGAGDGFFAGLLKGWLDDEPWARALGYANACGAFAVSRHGCTPAYPSLEELRFFLERGVIRPDLRNDAELEQLHWSTNRKGDWSTMRVFAFDHRLQLEQMDGYTPGKGGAFKRLCLDAALRVQAGRPGYGILCDGRIGRTALHAASGSGLWIGRPCEAPGSRPLSLEPSLGLDCGELEEWARENVAAAHDLVRGFAVGRTIFGDAARAWMTGEIDDATAVSRMTERFARLCGVWDDARAAAQGR